MPANTTRLLGNAKILTGRYSVVLALFFASIAAVSTHLLIGFPEGDSTAFNVFWETYFTQQLQSGELYPRWLFNYFDGFGGPVFYFYAPLPFYLLSLISTVLGNEGPGFAVFTVANLALFFLSACAFYFFIIRYTDRFWATMLSILYLFMPYHYIDVEVRAALGESLAYVWIPLILIGLCRPERKWRHLISSAFCYAGLVFSHLPSALLVAPVIAIFALCSDKRSRWINGLGYALFIGVAGVAVSAIYVLPALSLRSTLPYDAWVTGSGPHFEAVAWLLGNEGIPSFGILVYRVLAIVSLTSIGSTLIFIVISRSEIDMKIRRLIAACMASLVLCWFLMSNLSQVIWESSSILSQVQFPWRLGVIVEFSCAVLLSLSVPAISKSLFFRSNQFSTFFERCIAVILVVVAGVAVISSHFPSTVSSKDELAQYHPLEYRPKWLVESYAYLPGKNIDDLANIELAYRYHHDGISRWKRIVEPLAAIASSRGLENGEMMTLDESQVVRTTISGKLDSPATFRLKKLYYPHWRVSSNSGESIETRADEQTGLLLFDLPSGNHELTLDRQLLPSEKAGFFISLTALIACLVGIRTIGHRRV